MHSATDKDSEIDTSVDIAMPRKGEIVALAYQVWEDRASPLGSPNQVWFLPE